MLLKQSPLAEELKKRMNGLKQEAYVQHLASKGFRVNQATISRLINKQCKRPTPKIKELCKYAGIDIELFVRKTSPRRSARLISALGQVWDGTPAHERWLARVIKSAGSAPR